MWFSHSLDPKDSKKPKFDHLCRRTFSGFSRILYFCLYLYVLCLFRIALSLWAILCMLLEMREYSLLYYGGFFFVKEAVSVWIFRFWNGLWKGKVSLSIVFFSFRYDKEIRRTHLCKFSMPFVLHIDTLQQDQRGHIGFSVKVNVGTRGAIWSEPRETNIQNARIIQ